MIQVVNYMTWANCTIFFLLIQFQVAPARIPAYLPNTFALFHVFQCYHILPLSVYTSLLSITFPTSFFFFPLMFPFLLCPKPLHHCFDPWPELWLTLSSFWVWVHCIIYLLSFGDEGWLSTLEFFQELIDLAHFWVWFMLGPSTVHKNLRKKNGSASMYPHTIVSLHSSRRMMSTTVLQPSLNAAEGSKSFSFD